MSVEAIQGEVHLWHVSRRISMAMINFSARGCASWGSSPVKINEPIRRATPPWHAFVGVKATVSWQKQQGLKVPVPHYL